MFQELPHISEASPVPWTEDEDASLPLPHSMFHRPSPPSGSHPPLCRPPPNPAVWNVPATQANPVLVPNEFHVPGQGRPAPQVHRPKKKRSASMFFLGLVLVVGLGGAAAYALDLFELPSTGGTTTSSTPHDRAADGSDGTAARAGPSDRDGSAS
ncbi:MAG: hypothetical protein R2710_02865 [Acidimicrobiales bacterium]